ncbi:MAG: hypothetical protein HY928_12270 [Elusimicrobia bacterium]|nr:hypothetical protein [Elusimicrobiota bacterium]
MNGPDEGVLVGTGSFRVDREAALKKLAAFQLSREDLLVPWVRCAEAVGATRLELSVSPRGLRVLMDGTPFSLKDLADPYYALFDGVQAPPGVAHLAVGLLGLSRLAPKSLRAASGDGVEVRAVQGKDARELREVPPGLPVHGTSIEADFPGVGRQELLAGAAGLEGRLAMGRVLVVVNGDKKGPERPRGAPYRLASLRTLVAPSRDPGRGSSRVRMSVAGVTAQTYQCSTPWGPVDAVFSGDDLTLDASLSRVVMTPAVEAALKALRAKMGPFVCSLAKVQAREGVQTRRLLMDSAMREVWAGSAEYRGRDAEITREALERTLWLRESCRRVLSRAERDDDDVVRRALRRAPIFMAASGGWLSWEDLLAVSDEFSAMYFSRRPAFGFPVPGADGKPRHLKAARVVWAVCDRDAADLRRLADRRVVEELA